MNERQSHDDRGAVEPWVCWVLAWLCYVSAAPWDKSHWDQYVMADWARALRQSGPGNFYGTAPDYPRDHLPGDMILFWILGRLHNFAGSNLSICDALLLKSVPIIATFVCAFLIGEITKGLFPSTDAGWVVRNALFAPGIFLVAAIWGQWNILSSTVLMVGIYLFTVVEITWPTSILAWTSVFYACIIKPQFFLSFLSVPYTSFARRVIAQD